MSDIKRSSFKPTMDLNIIATKIRNGNRLNVLEKSYYINFKEDFEPMKRDSGNMEGKIV